MKIENLLIATANKGKIREIEELLKSSPVQNIISPEKFNIIAPEEDGETFQENAEIKAIHYAKSANMHALADDSGLVIPILNNIPGIHSARFATENGGFPHAMKKLEEMIKLKDPTYKNQKIFAYFVCVLSLSSPDKIIKSFIGKVEGELVFPATGNQGFGYDPIFKPNGYDITFGEMKNNEKQKISHRGDAFKKLLSFLEK